MGFEGICNKNQTQRLNHSNIDIIIDDIIVTYNDVALLRRRSFFFDIHVHFIYVDPRVRRRPLTFYYYESNDSTF